MMRIVLVVSLVLGVAAPAIALADDEPPSATMRVEKPAGFWGGAKRGEGAYRWKLLGVGAGLAVLTGGLLLRTLRRAARARAAGDNVPARVAASRR